MGKIITSVLLACLLSTIVLTGCGQQNKDADPPREPAEDGIRTIVDGNGRRVEIPEKLESIVCAGVGALRYTCYVGGQDLVVGVDRNFRNAA